MLDDMNTEQPTTAPVACTLDAGAMSGREQEWQTVMTTALRRRVATPSGVLLEFRPDPETDHALLDLVHAERGCCAWASWTLASSSESTLVEVSAGEPGVPVLHAMFVTMP
jgi:hypothetical protein